MPRVKVKLNSAGMNELLESAAVGSWVGGLAQRAAAQARATAPVVSGEYQSSIFSKTVSASSLGIHFEGGAAPNRPVGIVASSSDHALVIESRTGNLARSLDAAR